MTQPRTGGPAAFQAAITNGLSEARAAAAESRDTDPFYAAMSDKVTAGMDKLVALYNTNPALLSQQELRLVRDLILTQQNRAAK